MAVGTIEDTDINMMAKELDDEERGKEHGVCGLWWWLADQMLRYVVVDPEEGNNFSKWWRWQ